MARLDMCYRTLAAAAAASCDDDQEALLRERIGAYFEEAADDSAATHDAGADGAGPSQEAAGLAASAVKGRNVLAGLPLRAPPPALALDVRELLAFARRGGGSGVPNSKAPQVPGSSALGAFWTVTAH